MNYANAFKCSDCPESNGAKGCPGWLEFVAMDISTGREELKKMCFFQAMPVFLTEVIKASNRPAAAVESIRNEMVQGLGNVAAAVTVVAKQLTLQSPLPGRERDVVALNGPEPAPL